jgi:hypothetical protein
LVAVEKKFAVPSDTKTLLVNFIELYKAGSPTQSGVYWVKQSPKELARLFCDAHQIEVSNGVIKRLLKELGYGRRQLAKELATGFYAQRDLQFKIIFNLVSVMSLKSPVISIDCKKKERLGTLYREGTCYCTEPIEVYDHDYEHLGEGKVIPHGIYDLQVNKGYVSVGNSRETAEFIMDNLRWWWSEHGRHLYPEAQNILILCDAGGANSYRHHIFKYELQKLAKEWGLSIIISHYPPYASKWNPIEHRLFCHVHAAMKGVMFDKYQTVKELIEKTYTKQGLTVIVRLNLKDYPKGLKCDKIRIDEKRIFRHPEIKELNYRIFP